MKIALHDSEKEHFKQKSFPNYALMKISAYHKSLGDTVEWWKPNKKYDKVYSSKVFDFTPENPLLPPDTIKGGTGYDVKSKLPTEIDDMFPDYSIYPECDYAIGYITRGCPNNCRWCIVPQKEGGIKPYRDWQQLVRPDSKKLVLMDNNILACEYGIGQLESLIGSGYAIDLNQGMDARLITERTAYIISRLKWIRFIRFSCDTIPQIEAIKKAITLLQGFGVKPYRLFIYLLVTPDLDNAVQRVEELKKFKGINIYAQAERNDRLGIIPNKLQLEFAQRYVYSGKYRKETWQEYCKRQNIHTEVESGKMKWDGQTYVDFIKESLMFLLGYEEKEKAETLNHNEYTTLFRSRHRGITQELLCKQDKVTMTCQFDGIDFDFHRPLNNLGDTVIKLTWSMAARHIRYWVKEEASEYRNKQEKALRDYERVIHTKLGDDELIHEYNFRCGENAAKKKFNEQAICCAKELYSRGLKHSLTNEHLEMLEIYGETWSSMQVISICESCAKNGECVPKTTDTCIAYESISDDKQNKCETLSPMDTKSETEEKEMTAAFNLGAMLSAPTIGESQITQIPCEMLIPYHNHKFELYSGERLDDMVESIKENGVLIPIIVQPLDGKYEILIGHNRWNASKLAGKPTVPAIIKDGLTEDEAEMYVIESNLMQRGFDDLKISEQAAVIAMRHSKMFSQGKRNDIRRELEQMSQIDEPTDTNRELGEEYGMSRAKIARLVRIDKLFAPIKEYVDNGKLSIRAAVELSYTSDKAQTSIANLLDSFKIDEAKAHLIRENGAETEDGIIRLLTLDVKQPKPRSYKLNGERFGHFFEEGTTPDEIENIIEMALTAYFGEQQTLDLSDV